MLQGSSRLLLQGCVYAMRCITVPFPARSSVPLPLRLTTKTHTLSGLQPERPLSLSLNGCFSLSSAITPRSLSLSLSVTNTLLTLQPLLQESPPHFSSSFPQYDCLNCFSHPILYNKPILLKQGARRDITNKQRNKQTQKDKL